MRRCLSLSIATAALLIAACSSTADTIVAGTGEVTDTVVVTTLVPLPQEEQPQADPEEELPVVQSAPESTTTIDRGPATSWQDRPLARVVLTADDLSTLGLDSGWEVGWADFIELDAPDQVEEEICGSAVPTQTSYFVASFKERELGMELDLNVMPTTGGTAASDFLTVLDRLASCPDLEDEFAAVSMKTIPIDVAGAGQSLVVTGTDATSPQEPIGLTLAAAQVDGHLFMVFVAQDSGTPATGDAELAVRALELSISRL